MEVLSRNITTMRGTFLFPRLNTAEMPPYAGYEGPPLYSCTLRVKAEDAQPLMDELDELFDENIKLSKKEHGARKVKEADRPYTPEFDRDTDEETGFILFRTKLPSLVTRRRDGKTFALRPDIFDAKGNPTDVEVGPGTVGKLRVEARSWYMEATKQAGIKLTVRAAQIIDLRQHAGGGDASSHGFGEEEGWETGASTAGFRDETEGSEESTESKEVKDDKGGNF